MSNLIVGIDGGGTSCRAAVADSEGRIMGRGKGGAANILTDPNDAVTHIIEATQAAFADAGLPSDMMARSHAVLGLAGTNVGDLTRYVSKRLPFATSDIESDGLIALQGALGDGDGAVAILGTGTIFIVRRGETVSYIGGWGFMIGDLGGGARIGRAVLEEALLAHDGIRPPSSVTSAILREFKGDPRELVEFARMSKPGDFGRFAPLVFEHAAKGDAGAIALVNAAALSVNEALDAVARDGCERLCLLGGLAALYPPWLKDGHRALLMEPAADALAGAVSLAAARFAQGQRPLREGSE